MNVTITHYIFYHFGHIRHLDSKLQESRRRRFLPLPSHSIRWEDGEFVCPLCQAYGNTALPFSPAVVTAPVTMAPAHKMSLDETYNLIQIALHRGFEVSAGGTL